MSDKPIPEKAQVTRAARQDEGGFVLESSPWWNSISVLAGLRNAGEAATRPKPTPKGGAQLAAQAREIDAGADLV